MTVRYLSNGECDRLRYELGLNVVGIGAEPYIGHAQIISIIQSYLASNAQDVVYTSSGVTTVGSNSVALTSVTGIDTGTVLVFDADEFLERCTVKRVVGLNVYVNCKKLHTVNTPVEIESGLTLVRGKLAELDTIAQRIAEAADSAGLKRVDEVEWKDGVRTVATELASQQLARRRELASLVNLNNILAEAGFSGGTGNRGFALY